MRRIVITVNNRQITRKDIQVSDVSFTRKARENDDRKHCQATEPIKVQAPRPRNLGSSQTRNQSTGIALNRMWYRQAPYAFVTGFSGTNVRHLGPKNTHVPKTDPNDVPDSQQDVQHEKTHAGHDE